MNDDSDLRQIRILLRRVTSQLQALLILVRRATGQDWPGSIADSEKQEKEEDDDGT